MRAGDVWPARGRPRSNRRRPPASHTTFIDKAYNQNYHAALRVNLVTFALASSLGDLAGALIAMYYGSVFPALGAQITLKGFAAAMLGGLGSIPGAIAGALLLGLIESYGVAALGSSFRNLFAFGLLIAVLIFRPSGLLGDRRAPPEALGGAFIANSRPLRLPASVLWSVAAAAALLPLVISGPYVLQVLINVWLAGLLALSLTFVAGAAGQVSLGHGGLLAIGGYASALLSLRLGWPVELSVPAAALITAALAPLLVAAAFRLRSHYIAIATLSLGEIITLTVQRFDAIRQAKAAKAGRFLPGVNALGFRA